MQTYTLKIQHDSVAEKVVWLLKHFEDEGVVIKKEDIDTKDIRNKIQQSVNEINMVKAGKLEAKPVIELLNAL